MDTAQVVERMDDRLRTLEQRPQPSLEIGKADILSSVSSALNHHSLASLKHVSLSPHSNLSLSASRLCLSHASFKHVCLSSLLVSLPLFPDCVCMWPRGTRAFAYLGIHTEFPPHTHIEMHMCACVFICKRVCACTVCGILYGGFCVLFSLWLLCALFSIDVFSIDVSCAYMCLGLAVIGFFQRFTHPRCILVCI